MIILIIYMMVTLEKLSKDFYDKYYYADFTAIAFIISFPSTVFLIHFKKSGEILLMIEDFSIGYMPSLLLLLIMNIIYGFSFLPCFYYHRNFKFAKKRQEYSFLLNLFLITSLLAFINTKMIVFFF